MSTLADLRQANLREQKQHEPLAPAPLAPSNNAPAAAPPEPVSRASEPISPDPGSSAPVSTPPADDCPPPTLALILETTEPSAPSAAFLNRVRARQSRKLMYAAGVKVTADMTPALFARAKRYCHDHGNVTLRQTLLDLLDEYLDEEGY